MPRASAFVVVFALVVVVALTVEALAAPPMEETARASDSRPPPQVLIEARVIELPSRYAGVGFDGTDFWLTRLGDAQNEPVFYSIDSHGQEQISFPQQQVYVPEGHLDITLWDDLLWCSQCIEMHAFNAMTGNFETWFNGPIFPCRTMVNDGTYWYVTGWGEHIYRGQWDGTPGGNPTWTPITDAAIPGASGLALDIERNCLWVTDYLTNSVHQYSKDGPWLGTIPFTGTLYGSPRGCCMAETPELDIVLAVLFTNPRRESDYLVLYQFDESPVEESTWGKVKDFFRRQ